MRTAPIVAVLAIVLAGTTAGQAPPPWETTLEKLQGHLDQVTGHLAQVHADLVERTAIDHPDLTERLAPEPPQPLPSGYGVLPEITADGPLRSVAPTRTNYSLEVVVRQIEATFAAAAALSGTSNATDRVAIEEGVDRYIELTMSLRRLERQLSYHRYWQRQVGPYREFFAQRNRILRDVDDWWRDLAGEEALPPAILDRIAPFRATPGLAIETAADGSPVLPVTVVTDIASAGFLEHFERAVDLAFSESEAARGRRFRIDVSFHLIEAGALYPEGPPETGTVLDEADHLARFPHDALVLTFGGSSTHAMTGRSIVLGPEPRSPRSLAHEFAHLLGFSDAYLRGFEGDQQGPYGAVLVEWTGVQNDLMGSPSHGEVTARMIEILLTAYKKSPGP